MFAQVSCPACQSVMSIPEGDMGKRLVCSHCQSPFFAGRTAPKPNVLGKPAAQPDPGFQKTMLGDTGPVINYNCPRCQASLEAPSIEAGTKKPCPACGQRLQVPAAPPPTTAAAPAPNLNKTMMASDERAPAPPPPPPIKYNCPNCKKPLESPANEAGTKKPCPACGQRLQVPAAAPATQQPNLNRTLLASNENRVPAAGIPGGYTTPTAAGAAPGAPAAAPAHGITIGSYTVSPRMLAIGAVVLLLLLLLVPAILRGGKTEDLAAQKKEIDLANAEVERKKAEAERMARQELEYKTQIRDMMARLATQEERTARKPPGGPARDHRREGAAGTGRQVPGGEAQV